MKRIASIVLTAAALAGLLTGCRNRPMDMDPMTGDTSHTTQETHTHTESATQTQTEKPTQTQTEPGTQEPLMPETDTSIPDDANGETTESGSETTESGDDITGKIRRHMPRMK